MVSEKAASQPRVEGSSMANALAGGDGVGSVTCWSMRRMTGATAWGWSLLGGRHGVNGQESECDVYAHQCARTSELLGVMRRGPKG